MIACKTIFQKSANYLKEICASYNSDILAVIPKNPMFVARLKQ